ncbi:uncharacterized protein LOC121967330 [Zingiber officinale]|uniref:uncharacterized protein LOC121967330 n=1 Tax=Zingiber officinale TaxID=94328 RepID=UPI001C4B91C5|nr:uncharacterized protein LOC121967330 [Zingiber officinale]
MSSSSSTSTGIPRELVKKRWLGFLIWQSIASAVLHLPNSIFFLRQHPSPSSPAAVFLLSFLAFHLSLLLLSLALFIVVSPHPDPSASLPELAAASFRYLLKALVGGFSRPSFTAHFSLRARRSLVSVLFLLICSAAGSLILLGICGLPQVLDLASLVDIGLRGVVFGLVYCLHYIYRKRWVLNFPIIQRPLFYSFKVGLSSALKRAFKLSVQTHVWSFIIILLLPDQFKTINMIGEFMVQQIRFYIGTLIASICWEISHHLLQVVHTRRCMLAPPKGSVVAERNPSDFLLESLEQDNSHLIQYLAYLDLCIVSESNAESWRRAAIFEQTGETYKRVINVCLKPLEQLISRLAEGFEGLSIDNSDCLSKQLNSPLDVKTDLSLHEAFNDFQKCSWCARSLGALTARSHSEDRYGVAQLTGCNKAVVTTLLSCLLAVEACLGKKTCAPSAHLLGAANIRWATFNAGKGYETFAVATKRKKPLLYAKAYALADVVRTSLYQIVSAFEIDMQANARNSVLEKNWINDGKPLYGTREILVYKLHLFLEYRAI